MFNRLSHSWWKKRLWYFIAFLVMIQAIGNVSASHAQVLPSPGSCIAANVQTKGDKILAPPEHPLVPIPDNKKWFPQSVATSHSSTICPQRNIQIVELRGWLHNIEQSCNSPDPDWHYTLEVDPNWAKNQRIDLNQLFRVGDNLNAPYQPSNTGALERSVATPLITVELWGWKPSYHPGETPPTGWGFSGQSGCEDVLWPFPPLSAFITVKLQGQPSRLFLTQKPLHENQYVKIVGSLVTDDPHEEEGGVPTWFCGNFGFLCGESEARMNTLKKRWGVGQNSQVGDPARWTEIHPPDLIELLPDPGHTETLREIAVLANQCPIGNCESQTVDENIFPPQPCSPEKPVLYYEEHVGMARGETNFSTITEGNRPGQGTSTGAQITSYPDHIHVHVKVQGLSPNKAFGKFKALYRVFCAPPLL